MLRGTRNRQGDKGRLEGHVRSRGQSARGTRSSGEDQEPRAGGVLERSRG